MTKPNRTLTDVVQEVLSCQIRSILWREVYHDSVSVSFNRDSTHSQTTVSMTTKILWRPQICAPYHKTFLLLNQWCHTVTCSISTDNTEMSFCTSSIFYHLTCFPPLWTVAQWAAHPLSVLQPQETGVINGHNQLERKKQQENFLGPLILS